MRYRLSFKKITFLSIFLGGFLLFNFFDFKGSDYLEDKFILGSNNTEDEKEALNIIPLNEIFYYEDTFSEAIENVGDIEDNDDLVSIIIPHHLVASDIIAKQISKTKDQDIENIIIIGPNHENVGVDAVTSLAADWETPFGLAEYNYALVEKFISDYRVQPSMEIFENEHSIGGLIPFVKYYHKDARVIPIVVSSYANYQDMLKLSEWLNLNLDEKSLIIYSIDFSHYLSKEESDANDKITKELILSGDTGKILTLNNDYVDSPSILALSLMQAQSNNLFLEINDIKNSYDYAIIKPRETTSYFAISFFVNLEENKKKVVNDVPLKFMFFGDLMLDRYVLDKVNNKSLDYLIKDLLDSLNLENYDLVSANLEGAVTNKGEHYLPKYDYDFAFDPEIVEKLKEYNFNFFNIANNHLSDQGEKGIRETEENLDYLDFNFSGCRDGLIDDCSGNIVSIKNKKIGLLGFSLVYSKINESDLASEIIKVKESTDLVLVNIHWGEEYEKQFNKKQQDLAHLMINAGADIIIGHHPHVVQGIEIYKGKLICYSLGNFTFDQYFSEVQKRS